MKVNTIHIPLRSLYVLIRNSIEQYIKLSISYIQKDSQQ